MAGISQFCLNTMRSLVFIPSSCYHNPLLNIQNSKDKLLGFDVKREQFANYLHMALSMPRWLWGMAADSQLKEVFIHPMEFSLVLDFFQTDLLLGPLRFTAQIRWLETYKP